MTDATILIIEGKHAEIPSFATDLQKKGFDVETAKSGSDAVSRLEKIAPHLVVVNAASLRSSGVRICQSIRDNSEKLPVILIIDKDTSVSKDAADVVLNLPFTVQKLSNRIVDDSGHRQVNEAGLGFKIDRHRLRRYGKRFFKLTETRLKIKVIREKGLKAALDLKKRKESQPPRSAPDE